jgi:hypothetical protein
MNELNEKLSTEQGKITDEPLLCPVLGFRFFMRKTYSNVEISNDDIDELNKEFSKYLSNKLDGENLRKFLPKNDLDVALNANHPLRINGFSPVIAYHFTEFVEEMKNKIDAD